MSKFADEGFLSTEMAESSEECQKRYAEWFVLCEEVNRYCMEQLTKLQVNYNNKQKYLTVALFIKFLGLFQGTIILMKKCMANETKILLRSLMETLFIFKAITKHEDLAEEYYKNHYLEKLKALRRIQSSSMAEEIGEGSQHIKRIKELENIVKQNKIKHTAIEEWARRAGMQDYYDTVYPYFSWTAHSSVIDIGQYLEGDTDDIVEHILWQPNIEEIEQLLLAAIESLVIALGTLNGLYSLGIEKNISAYDQRYKDLYKISTEK